MKKFSKMLSILTVFLTFNACSKTPSDSTAQGQASATAQYHKITAEEAKKQLDGKEPVILLDVRGQSEYDEKHIEGATLIPDTELKERAELELTDKNATILVYCRSGRRSKTAAELLVEMGYTKVYDFGGIEQYPYETVSK